ncbi:unnamed protein product [Peniophora sp. CBMAI 1063]|nr:unnamed protein product [Peniophora sp. CBMAI 1063]
MLPVYGPYGLNASQEVGILLAQYEDAASSYVPLVLLEGFAMGSLCACALLGSYILWIKLRSTTRALLITALWFSLTVTLIHWALSLRQLISLINGGLSEDTGSDALSIYEELDGQQIAQYQAWQDAWELLLPLVTETVLFGFSSVLFAVTACIYTRRWRSQGSLHFSPMAVVIPTLAATMYTLSMIHWAVSLGYFTRYRTSGKSASLHLTLVVLLSINAVLSDSIVLWRMCVVWDKRRLVLAFATVLIIAISVFNVLNLVWDGASVKLSAIPSPGFNVGDTEIIVIYGKTYVGLAAAFVSLASNACATALVGLKAWMHRRQLAELIRANGRRTLVERVMEILVDSGIVYTAIWALYCASFDVSIAPQSITPYSPVVITAVDHLDYVMAQLTSIYPLAIFILVAFDRVYHTRKPQMLSLSDVGRRANDGREAVTVTFDIDVERTALGRGSAYPSGGGEHEGDEIKQGHS